MDNSVTPEKVIEALEEVRNPEKEASEYTFLEEIEKIHPAPSKKGNKEGLANWIAELAVFEVDGSIVVDEGLVEEADKILAEQHDTGYDRTRIANIVYDSENRSGHRKSLAENRVDGHARLLNKVNEFYRETGRQEELENLYKDRGSLLDCNNMTGGNITGLDPATIGKWAVDELHEYLSECGGEYIEIPVKEENNTISSKSVNSNQKKGGDNTMTDTQYNHQLGTLAGKLNELDGDTDDLVHHAALLERQGVGALKAAGELIDEYRETGINVPRGVQSWIDTDIKPYVDGTASALDGIDSELDSFENEYLNGGFGISDAAKNKFSSAAGYDITQDL